MSDELIKSLVIIAYNEHRERTGHDPQDFNYLDCNTCISLRECAMQVGLIEMPREPMVTIIRGVPTNE